MRGPDAMTDLAPLGALLAQLRVVVAGLDDERFRRTPSGAVNGSIGAHVRHCLDHVRALCDGGPVGRIDYDARRRGTLVESDRTAALAALAAAESLLREVAVDQATPVEVVALVTPTASPRSYGSTFGREALFVLSHTIHHQALIAAALPPAAGLPSRGFGLAPATAAHAAQREQGGDPCAR